MDRKASLVLVAGLFMGSMATAKEWSSKRVVGTERGREIYTQMCMSCHGEKAAGDGPAAQALATEVPDLSSGLNPKQVEQAIPVVMRGNGVMPSYEATLSREEAKWVMQVMAQLPRKPLQRPEDQLKPVTADAPGARGDDEEEELGEAQAPPVDDEMEDEAEEAQQAEQ